jgi:hypothetical protein
VLTAAEIVTTQNTTNSYNQVIATLVAGAGGTLVDMNALYASFGAGVMINGYQANTGWLGGLYSLDGVHPTNTGYALIANQYITATNNAFGLSVPLVDVSAVAAKDPYFPPNIKSATASMRGCYETRRLPSAAGCSNYDASSSQVTSLARRGRSFWLPTPLASSQIPKGTS